MSLINQMLKELDARRSDVSGSDSYGQQVRAVPERRRVHPGWIGAGTGTIMLALGTTWFLLKSETPNGEQPAGLKFPLKLDVDLGATSLPAAVVPPSQPAPEIPATAGQMVLPSAPELPANSSTATSAPSVPDAGQPAKSAPKARISSVGVAAVPTVSKIVPSAKMLAAPRKNDETPGPETTISKQIQTMTPQQRAENEYRKALQALQGNRLAEAVKGLEEALQINPNHVGARYTLIGALLDSQRQEDALVKTREGLSLDPAQPGLSMILARLQLERGELRPAIETLERALPYAADRADYQAFLAALKQRDEQHKQAIEHYLAALRKVPENGAWWMGLGISLQAERRLPEALEAFKRAKSSNNLSQELVSFVDSRLAQLQR